MAWQYHGSKTAPLMSVCMATYPWYCHAIRGNNFYVVATEGRPRICCNRREKNATRHFAGYNMTDDLM